MSYIKAHSFGYQKSKTNKDKRTQCRNAQCTRVQIIKIKVPTEYPIYDKFGNIVGSVTHVHVHTKTIYHTDKSYKSGRTFAEVYWDSVLNSPNFTAYQNKFRKKDS